MKESTVTGCRVMNLEVKTQVFTSRRGVPVFKSMPIKCHHNHVLWAVRSLEHSPEDFFLTTTWRRELICPRSGSFCLRVTVLSLNRHRLDYDPMWVRRDTWKPVEKICSVDMGTWPLLKAEDDSKGNAWSFSFHLDGTNLNRLSCSDFQINPQQS